MFSTPKPEPIALSVLVLLLLALAALGSGCLGEEAKPSPSPSPPPVAAASVSPTPLPSPIPTPTLSPLLASPTPSPSPSPSLQQSANATPQCTQERQCLSEKPKYCENGVVVNNCGKCGCPSGLVCGRAGPGLGFSCIPPSISIENWTSVGPGGNLTEILPTPSPTPTVLPWCDLPSANASNKTVFVNNVASAYATVFARNTSFTEFEANAFVSLEQWGYYKTEIYLYAGKYRGWSPFEESYLSEINSSACRKKIFVNKDSPSTNPNHYNFKMHCFNWTYLVDAQVTEYVFNTPQGKTAESFAVKLLDYCK